MSFYMPLFLFFALTSLNSTMTTIATLLEIGSNFQGIAYLSAALGLRVLSSGIFSYYGSSLISILGIRRSFYVSQLLGILTLGLVSTGFFLNNYMLLLLGILSMGLPLALVSILITITFKVLNSNNSFYRRQSGTRETVFGAIRLIGCLATPFILLHSSIFAVLSTIGFIYILSIFLLSNITFPNEIAKHEGINQKRIQMSAVILKHKATRIYGIKLFASMLLVSFIALAASSKEFLAELKLPDLFHESLWSVEAAAMIIGSSLYILLRKSNILNKTQPILVVNASVLFILAFFSSSVTLILCNFCLSLLVMLSFYKFRDDYVLAAKENPLLINGFSAFSLAYKDIICTISPAILGYLFWNYTFLTAVSILLLIQIFLFLISLFTNKE